MSPHQGPWVVTVSKHCACGGCDARVVSRWAYGTLEEVREAVQALIRAHVPEDAPWRVAGRTYIDFDDVLGRYAHGNGGSITLPDGTRIEVEARTIDALRDELSPEAEDEVVLMMIGTRHKERVVCAAWNAEHGIGIERSGR